jgi:hypothetical protein
LFAEATSCLNARGHRFGKRHRNVGLVAGQDFLAAVVAAISNGFELIDAEDLFRLSTFLASRPARYGAVDRDFTAGEERSPMCAYSPSTWRRGRKAYSTLRPLAGVLLVGIPGRLF